MVEDVEARPEDIDIEFFSMSMLMPDMSMSMSYTDGPDCAALQQMWNADPKDIEGSDLMLIKQDCDKGLLSTADEVAQAIEAFESPFNPTVDEQLALEAEEICASALDATDEDLEEIQAACKEDFRDDENVVDALVRLVAKHSQEEGTFTL